MISSPFFSDSLGAFPQKTTSNRKAFIVNRLLCQIAKLFGIRLMKNFNIPYFSRNIAEFWKRWHISLNKWFINYLYIPLGGSKCGKKRQITNTLLVFAASGLWHGANWTFIFWGLYHSLLFIPNIIRRQKHETIQNKIISKDLFFNTYYFSSCHHWMDYFQKCKYL